MEKPRPDLVLDLLKAILAAKFKAQGKDIDINSPYMHEFAVKFLDDRINAGNEALKRLRERGFDESAQSKN
jgi:hypothetical protein